MIQARGFNDTPIKPQKCIKTLTKLLMLLNQVRVYSITESRLTVPRSIVTI